MQAETEHRIQYKNMHTIHSLAVYAASSNQVPHSFTAAAERLGEILSKEHIQLIYGGGHAGLMGAIADASLRNGGEVVGVIPQFMVEQGWDHKGCSELIVTKDMHERKSVIAARADAFVALPGGIGTFEELLEILTWKQLGLHTKPIGILNVDGYYDNLLRCFEQMVEGRLMRSVHLENMMTVMTTAEEVLPRLREAPMWDKTIRKYAQL